MTEKNTVINRSLQGKSIQEMLLSFCKSKEKQTTKGTMPTDVYTLH